MEKSIVQGTKAKILKLFRMKTLCLITVEIGVSISALGQEQ